ncbi:MAG: enoyl-CoA hydratase/isomerase family protein [Nitrospirae bacterium]|nr:enoyl-CoA hydratase/isomerase family protein [Nitrospirota bacterium]
MAYEKITLSIEPPKATIAMNDPAVMNAHSTPMLMEIQDAVRKIEADERVIVGVIEGAGGHFCAGINLNETHDMTALEGRKLARLLHETFSLVRTTDKLYIAKIRGNCLGAGLELAVSCDLLIGTETSKYGFPHMKIGIPSIVEAGIVPQMIGITRARELYYLAKSWDGKRAHEEGLINRVVPDRDLDAAADEWVETLSGYSPVAMAVQKDICHKWMTADLETAIDFSINSVCISFTSEDQKEGMRAFLEKRKPVFKGR